MRAENMLFFGLSFCKARTSQYLQLNTRCRYTHFVTVPLFVFVLLVARMDPPMAGKTRRLKYMSASEIQLLLASLATLVDLIRFIWDWKVSVKDRLHMAPS